MDLTSESLNIFLLLMPGFVSSIVLDTIVVRRPKDRMTLVVEAFVFSFLTYAAVAFGSWCLTGKSHPVATDPPVILVTFLVALVLPLVVGGMINSDWHMSVLRNLRITRPTARDTTWLDVFMDQERYVIVTLVDGRRVFGWPMYYSNDPEEGFLYLYDPAWVTDDGTYTDLGVHGLFLVRKDSIDSIAFTHLSRDNAQQVESKEA